ncbi:site-specific integrase [Cyanobacterium sp. Dongsha4]|uniref:tyrosine-type recombinase/integrase n=1 Tax=Cyanobacterium sp. DS4 TaxID=2878255 RepID=UPI002E81D131|nr:site-specific integrase [Cyanobacterium sp. Dongsha4]WVL02523.1 tyrosine-type recombinase/integrase [Cyanobacterium sp. Dongsha4]
MASHQVKVQQDAREYIRLSFPSFFAQKYFGKKQYYISFGVKADPSNMAEAYQARNQLQKDLEKGTFNPNNLDKYKHSSKKTEVNFFNYEDLNPLELLDKFTEYHGPNLAITTLENKYKKLYRDSLKGCEQINITTDIGQLQIAQHLRQTRGRYTQIEVLSVLKNSMDWAIENGIFPPHTPNNFPSHLAKARKLPKTTRAQVKVLSDIEKDCNKKAWTKEQKDLIIKSYHERQIKSSFYRKIDIPALIIEFLFCTGMRHGEAFGLRWGKVRWQVITPEGVFTELLINESYSSTCKIIKDTKNHKTRTIKLSQRAVEILQEIKAAYKDLGIGTGNNDFIFLNSQKRPYNTHLLITSWLTQTTKEGKIKRKGIVSELVKEGKLPNYIDAYSTRRTFASLQIQAGVDPRTVADYIGDNVETVLSYYYQGKENFVPIAV